MSWSLISRGVMPGITVLTKAGSSLTDRMTVASRKREYEGRGVSMFWSRYVAKSGEDRIKIKLNPVALLRERTLPTERPPLIGEVCVNFCG
jgi:hypothetical protein